jgi:hypothetical protein
MTYRLRSVLVISVRRLHDSLVGAGFYVAVSVGLAVALTAIVSFTAAVDSSGFDYRQSPLYNVVGGLITGAFGPSLLSRMFGQGPLLFALHAGAIPVVLYLAGASVHRLSVERSSGALELYTYGPTDVTACVLASILKDAALTLVALVSLLLLSAAAAAADNLAFPPFLLAAAAEILLGALGIYAYGLLIALCVDNGSAAISVFSGLLVIFLLCLAGSHAIVIGFGAQLAGAVAAAIGWLSPLGYWAVFLVSRSTTNIAGTVAGVAGPLALAAAILAGCHLVARARGVRA